MLFRGMYADSLRLLAGYHPTTENPEGTIKKLAIEAVALTRQRQIPMASERLMQAEGLCKDRPYAACGDVLRASGIVAVEQGRFMDARRFFLEAFSFAQSNHNRLLEASAALNLGWVALQVDRYDEAVDWSRAAYRAAVELGAENTVQGATGNLGWAFYQLGDSERALEQFLEAEKSAERLGNVRYQLKWLSTAGYIYRDSGDWAHASDSYRRALYLAQQIRSREDIVNALEDLARVSVLSGKSEDAHSYIDQLTFMENASASRPSAYLLLTEGMLAASLHEDTKAEDYFRGIQNDLSSQLTTRLSAGAELARLLESQHHIEAAEQMYRSTLTAYESARATLKSEELRLPFGANATKIYDSYIHLLMQEGRIDAALATADQSRARTLEQRLGVAASKSSLQSAALNPRQIAQKADSTLLFYWLGERQSYLWAITPAKIEAFTLPAQQEIAARIGRYRKTILDLRDPRETADREGQALYQSLLAPAIGLVRPEKPVVVLADGALSELNFETLLAPGPGPESGQDSNAHSEVHYLLDDLTLVSAPSLAMLGAPQPVHDRGRRLLLLGNPVSPSQDFPNLPLFGFEMTQVESHFGKEQTAVFTGQQATPAAYLTSNPAQYSYIHFVSHAIANRTNPLDSAIVLSRSTADQNSFKLYARDIIEHPIDARLVTISACYGSGMRSYAGEGLVGLSWAFLRAGAQRVIGALWEVSDNSTPRLMDALYRSLEDGESPAVSLRKAKLALLHSQGGYRLPYYWAPFQMYDRQ